MEKLEERYLRWAMGLDSNIPGYMIREELQRGKLKGKVRRGVKEGWGKNGGGAAGEKVLEGDERKT